MAISNYGCLKLKIPSPQGVIVVTTSTTEAYRYEQEGTTLAMTDVAAADFARIRRQQSDKPPNGSKGNTVAPFHPADDTKIIQICPKTSRSDSA